MVEPGLDKLGKHVDDKQLADVPEPPPEGVTVIPGAADYLEKLPEPATFK